MPFQNFDELQIALTDPRSRYFQQAMTEMQSTTVLQHAQRKKIDAIILQILADEKLERGLLLQEQVQQAQATSKKYLDEISLQQTEEKQKTAREKMELEPKKLIDYLTAHNHTLEGEIKDLQFKLLDLGVHQQKIKKAWDKQQATAAEKFAAVLAKQATHFISPTGEAIRLDEKETAQICTKVFSQADPVLLVKRAPHLAELDVPLPQLAETMNTFATVMLELRLVAAFRNVRTRFEEPEKMQSYSSQELLALLQKNPQTIQLLLDTLDDAAIHQPKVDLIQQALQTNETFIFNQINAKKALIASNKKIIDVAKVEIENLKTPPFSISARGIK